MDLRKIDAETPLDIFTDGYMLIVTPVRDGKRARKCRAALDKTNRRYGRALGQLAE